MKLLSTIVVTLAILLFHGACPDLNRYPWEMTGWRACGVLGSLFIVWFAIEFYAHARNLTKPDKERNEFLRFMGIVMLVLAKAKGGNSGVIFTSGPLPQTARNRIGCCRRPSEVPRMKLRKCPTP